MQMSAMKACFQIAECSKFFAKIRIFYQRAYTYFSEVITFIGVFNPLYLNTLTILSPDFLLQTYAPAIQHVVLRQGLRRT